MSTKHRSGAQPYRACIHDVSVSITHPTVHKHLISRSIGRLWDPILCVQTTWVTNRNTSTKNSFVYRVRIYNRENRDLYVHLRFKNYLC